MAGLSPQLRYDVLHTQLGLPLIRQAGWMDLHATSPLSRHRNDGYEVTCAVRGEVAWELAGGRSMTVTGGHISLMQPGIEHRGQLDVIRPVKLFWIVFDPRRVDAERNTPFSGRELARLDRQFGGYGNCTAPAGQDLLDLIGRLREPMRQLWEKHDDPLLRPWTASLLCQVVIAVLRSLELPGRQEASPAIGRATDYIHAHFAQPLDVQQLAEVTSMRRTRFYELFGQYTGQSPADYLSRVRCQRAMHLLAHSRLSITRIALDCGFASSQYFARAMRRYAGRSPSEIRRHAGASEH